MRRSLYEQLYVRALGQKIADLRDEAEITQPQLAARIGSHASSISRYESGRQDIPSGRLAAIADAVGIPVSALVAIADERARAALLLHERIRKRNADQRAEGTNQGDPGAAGRRDRASYSSPAPSRIGG